jgi:hypothetical protein
MKSVNCSKLGYASITCWKISNIPYNLIFTIKFNDSSIWITIISCDYLNLSLANEYVGDVTILTQVIEYNQNFLKADQPIRLQYSNQIKLFKEYLKNFEQVIRYSLVWGSLHFINREAVYEKRKLFQARLCKYNLFKNLKYAL